MLGENWNLINVLSFVVARMCSTIDSGKGVQVVWTNFVQFSGIISYTEMILFAYLLFSWLEAGKISNVYIMWYEGTINDRV